MSSGPRVCPQCGNTTSGLTCPIDGWATVPSALVSEARLVPGGVLLGRFEVGAFLEDDGPLAVYGGRVLESGRPVRIAVVVVPPTATLAEIGRMQRAARALEGLRHPGLAAVFASGTTDRGDLAVVSEHVEGPTLAELLIGGELGPEQTLSLGLALFDALEAAHAAGIAHHDLSPDRIRMAPGRVVICDIGYADLLRSPAASASGHVVGEGEVPLLARGLPYRAPEQARDRTVTRHADIYATGAILYEALTGRPMFAEKSAADYLIAHMMKAPPTPATLGEPVYAGLVSLVMRCVEKKPWNRPPSAAAAREELEQVRARALTATASATRRVITGATQRPQLDEPPRIVPMPQELSPSPVGIAAVKPSNVVAPAPVMTRGEARPGVEAPVAANRTRRAPPWVWTAASVALFGLGFIGMLHLVGERQAARTAAEVPAVARVEAPTKPAVSVRAEAPPVRGPEEPASAPEVTRTGAASEAMNGRPEAVEVPVAPVVEARPKLTAWEKKKVERAAVLAVADMEAARTRATWKAYALVEAERRAQNAQAAANAKAEADAKKKAEALVAANAKAEADAKKKAEALVAANAKAEADAKRKAEAQAAANTKAEADAKRKAEAPKVADKGGGPKVDPKAAEVSAGEPTTPSNAPGALNRALLSTVPSGAAVLVDGRLVGRTPMTVSWNPAGSVSVWVTLAGHEPANLELTDRQNGKMLRLELVSATPAATP